jgi:hypothetical protein
MTVRSGKMHIRIPVIVNVDLNAIFVLPISIGLEKLEDHLLCNSASASGAITRPIAGQLIQKDKETMKDHGCVGDCEGYPRANRIPVLALAYLVALRTLSSDEFIIRSCLSPCQKPDGVPLRQSPLSKRTNGPKFR